MQVALVGGASQQGWEARTGSGGPGAQGTRVRKSVSQRGPGTRVSKKGEHRLVRIESAKMVDTRSVDLELI